MRATQLPAGKSLSRLHTHTHLAEELLVGLANHGVVCGGGSRGGKRGEAERAAGSLGGCGGSGCAELRREPGAGEAGGKGVCGLTQHRTQDAG